MLRTALFVMLMLFGISHARAQLSEEMRLSLAARDSTLEFVNTSLRAADAPQVQCSSVEVYLLPSFDDAVEKAREVFAARDWGLMDYALLDWGLVLLIDTDETNPRALGLGDIIDHDEQHILWFSRCLQRTA